ncbi:Uncharacterised protein [Mycobacteroides abscessus]|nr:Uncharacterised protein [Mycobacteroides abscessus]
MMKVPMSVIIGKSPMKTVWLLISPVLLLMNSAVTNSGAAYVMSLSLHSSTGALTSSKRGSLNDSDIEPEKSSIGESSVRISSRPPVGFTSPRAVATSRQRGDPTSHSKDSVCTSSRPGTASGSRSLAKESRLGAPGTELVVALSVLVWRETAKIGPPVLPRICDVLRKQTTKHTPDRSQQESTPSWRGKVGRRQPAQRLTIAYYRAAFNCPVNSADQRWLAASLKSHASVLPNRLTPHTPSVKR